MSLTLASQSAHAGISDMINGYFTFRQDQKPLVAPERTLPPKHIVSPNYHEGRASNWSNYYTRPDLQATENLDSSSMVMRPDPNYRPPNPYQNGGYNNGQNGAQNGHRNGTLDPAMGYAGIQRRAHLNALEKYDGNIYIGDPGKGPFEFNNDGKAGQKTQISKPKSSWQSAASNKIQPRIGDYDYVKSHKGAQNNNAFGDYSGTISDENAQEITRSPGYFTKNEVPLPTQNEGYYKQDLQSNYIVQPRDSLSGISGQDKIYGDWKMWPLIYDGNRQQIQDPDLIHPGQNLDIPRDYSATSEQSARQRGEAKKAPYNFYDGR
tara:strand:- start:225818 stop:226780 length:963 start_codon:yes stop_codon:yes gene_type:complete